MALDAVGLQQPMRYRIDISSGLIQTPMRSQLMKGDRQANRVIVEIVDGGKSVDMTGVAVSGSFIRPPDAVEVPLEGETKENEAIVSLSDACYAREGYCEINVMLTVGGTSRTILALTGYVLGKGSGAVIDVNGVLPSIEELMAQLTAARDTAVAAAVRAEAAARRAENAAGGGGSGEGGGGADGEDGGYYQPSVNSSGVLSWTPSKTGMPQVASANIKGPAGNAATVTIGQVSTLPAGSNAYVTNTGTNTNAVLNFGIPKGADGSGSGSGSGGSGADGEDGGYYIPSVNSSGDLSWQASKSDMPPVGAANIKGPQGAPGYSPVRGTDYWTAADIAQIKSYVDDAILNGVW